MLTSHNILQTSHIGKKPYVLKSSGNSLLYNLMRFFAGKIFPFEKNLSTVSFIYAGNYIKNSSFSCSIGTYQATYLPLTYFKVKIVYCSSPAKYFSKFIGLQHHFINFSCFFILLFAFYYSFHVIIVFSHFLLLPLLKVTRP